MVLKLLEELAVLILDLNKLFYFFASISKLFNLVPD